MENANVLDRQALEQSSEKDERQRNSPSRVILREGRIREGKEKVLVPRQIEMSLRMEILKKLMCPSQKMLPWRLIDQVLQILKQMLVHQKQMLASN